MSRVSKLRKPQTKSCRSWAFEKLTVICRDVTLLLKAAASVMSHLICSFRRFCSCGPNRRPVEWKNKKEKTAVPFTSSSSIVVLLLSEEPCRPQNKRMKATDVTSAHNGTGTCSRTRQSSSTNPTTRLCLRKGQNVKKYTAELPGPVHRWRSFGFQPDSGWFTDVKTHWLSCTQTPRAKTRRIQETRRRWLMKRRTKDEGGGRQEDVP